MQEVKMGMGVFSRGTVHVICSTSSVSCSWSTVGSTINPLPPHAHIISPPLPDSLPDDLKDLLQKLLEKDQKKRITIPQIREHPWILKSSRPVPSREENCNVEISVSEEDMEQAFKTYRTPIHILVSVGQTYLLFYTSLRHLWYLYFA